MVEIARLRTNFGYRTTEALLGSHRSVPLTLPRGSSMHCRSGRYARNWHRYSAPLAIRKNCPLIKRGRDGSWIWARYVPVNDGFGMPWMASESSGTAWPQIHAGESEVTRRATELNHSHPLIPSAVPYMHTSYFKVCICVWSLINFVGFVTEFL